MKSLIKLIKGAGWLNILGMSAAFAAIYIIGVQVSYDLGYNKQIKDVDRIYVMYCKDNKTSLSRPFAQRIIDKSPCVEKYGVTTAFGGNGSQTTVCVGDEADEKEYELICAEYTRDALDVLNFTPLVGSFEGMGTEEKVALSENAASRMQVSLGDVLHCNDGKRRAICAIYKNMPLNCIVGRVEMVYSNGIERKCINDFNEWSFMHIVKLHSNTEKEILENNSIEVVKELIAEQQDEDTEEKPSEAEVNDIIESARITLLPLKELYFFKQNIGIEIGNQTTTYVFLLIAILILLITLINYVNFFMAQVPTKLKIVNTRKILGSTRRELVMQFMLESGMLVGISICLALVWVMLFKQSSFIGLISSSLEFKENSMVLMVTMVAGLLMTLISSIYPALYVTSFSPALALKGSMGQAKSNQAFRNSLVGFQFIITLAFVTCTLLLKSQYDFMMNYDMGFNKENLFTASISVNKNSQQALTAELENKSAVKSVAWADGPLVDIGGMTWGTSTDKAQDLTLRCYPVSYNFLDVLGIEIVEGRNFLPSDEQSENGVFILNQKAKKQDALTLEHKIYGHQEFAPIVGFCEDFSFRPLQYGTTPFAFFIWGKHSLRVPYHLYIRSNQGATYQEVLQALRETVAAVAPNCNLEKIELNFFDQELSKQYQKERKLIQLTTLFSVLAIVISLMGVIGLLLFETNYRRKEIGVRRVHGAEISEIILMFNRRFIGLLAVGFVVAAPICYFVMDYYYSTYAYHVCISIWPFVEAFVLVLVITMAVVTLCTYKTAIENPSKSLKSE